MLSSTLPTRVGFLAVLLFTLAACNDSAVEPDDANPTTTTAATSTSLAVGEGATEGADAGQSEPAGPVRVFVPSGLTPELRQAVGRLDKVKASTVVEVAAVHLASSLDHRGHPVDVLEDRFVIQLDARAVDRPQRLMPFAPELAEILEELDDDEVVITTSSAIIRRLNKGARLTFDSGSTYTVARVIPDDSAGADFDLGEVVFANLASLEAAGAASVRPTILVDYDGPASDLEEILLELNGGDGVRVFGGDDGQDRDLPRPILTPIQVKQVFGEFSHRPLSGRQVEVDPAWFEENIVLARVPILGRMRCHQIYIDALTEVMRGLRIDGLEDLIDPSTYQGCWTPRHIGGSKRLSRHSWGIAADINFGNEPDASPGSPVHPILLERMEEAGFVSGHQWVNADPGHFEYVGPPDN